MGYGGAIVGRQQPEKTEVRTETEVRIPTLMAIVGALAVDVIDLGLWLIVMTALLWKRGWRPAWTYAGKSWGAWVIGLLIPWGVFAFALAVSFFVQTIDKHAPSPRKQREADDPILSAWGMFGKRYNDDDEPKPEPDYEKAIRVEVKENARTTTIGNIPNNVKMWNFAYALVNGGKFSKKASKMSRDKWLVVRNEFLGRGWAKWKNPMWHQAGLEPTTSGLTALSGYMEMVKR